MRWTVHREGSDWLILSNKKSEDESATQEILQGGKNDGLQRNMQQLRKKELMWKLYQKYGSMKEVAQKVKRDRNTVSRYVHEFEAAVGAVSVVINASER